MRYVISLRASHSTLAPEVIVSALRMRPAIAQSSGGLRMSRRGEIPNTMAKETFVLFGLSCRSRDSLESSLRKWTTYLESRKRAIDKLRRLRVRLEFFVGVFLEGSSGLLLDSQLSATLGDLGVDLSFDIYPADLQKQQKMGALSLPSQKVAD